MQQLKSLIYVFVLCGLIACCAQDNVQPVGGRTFRTKYVIIVVQDGARWSETFGDSTHANIPFLYQLSTQGVLCSNFSNSGGTYTNAGHTAITTGVNQEIDNSGMELPDNPSIFQYYLKTSGYTATKAWVVASKGKLHVLDNCKDEDWKDQFQPMINCGIDSVGNGYREDTVTLAVAKNIISQHLPELMLVNFKEPDVSGHTGDWNAYLQQIRNTDSLIFELWKHVNANPVMKNKTAFFITNDHGRHLDSVSNGFVSHGDGCEGCRKIFLVAAGPDFKTNFTDTNAYELTDIAETIARLLNFHANHSEGKFMSTIIF